MYQRKGNDAKQPIVIHPGAERKLLALLPSPGAIRKYFHSKLISLKIPMKAKMSSNYTLFLISFTLYFSANAQTQIKRADLFLSRIYFPFDFGVALSNAKTLNTGSVNKTGVEFRLKEEQGVFFRYSYVNQKNNFVLPENQVGSVVAGKLTFNNHLMGVGMRIGKNEIRGIGLLEVGVSSLRNPQVSVTASGNYKVREIGRNMPVLKINTGVEYYVAPNAALVIEAAYFSRFTKTNLWSKSLQTLTFSIGLTTTLF
jgi:hypothetical protein